MKTQGETSGRRLKQHSEETDAQLSIATLKEKQTSNPQPSCGNTLEEEEQTKPKANRRSNSNDENRKIEKINQSEAVSLQKSTKLTKLLARLVRKNSEGSNN